MKDEFGDSNSTHFTFKLSQGSSLTNLHVLEKVKKCVI